MAGVVDIFIHGLAICEYKKGQNETDGDWIVHFVIDNEHKLNFYDSERKKVKSFGDVLEVEVKLQGNIKQPRRQKANRRLDGAGLDFENVFNLEAPFAHKDGVKIKGSLDPTKYTKLKIDKKCFFYAGPMTLESYVIKEENGSDEYEIGQFASTVCIRIEFGIETTGNKIIIDNKKPGEILEYEVKDNNYLELHFNNDCYTGCKAASDFKQFYTIMESKSGDGKKYKLEIKNFNSSPFPVDGAGAAGRVNCFAVSMEDG